MDNSLKKKKFFKLKNKNKLLLSSSLVLFLSNICKESFAGVIPRAINLLNFEQVDLISGKGLNGGTIPNNATNVGLFLIPNGGALNPTLENGSQLTFQKIGNVWTPILNQVDIKGQLAPVFFSMKEFNLDGLDHMISAAGNQIKCEDTLGVGDGDFNDAVLEVQIQATQNNNQNLISLDNGNYNIENIDSLEVQIKGISTNAGYSNSFGHYFTDGKGNILTGKVDFKNIKNSINTISLSKYSYSPFVSGSTLQFYQPSAINANMEGVVIAAVDVGPISVGNGTSTLNIQKSSSVGSVVNIAGNINNLLTIKVFPDTTLTLIEHGGTFLNGKVAATNDFSGLKKIDGITASSSTIELSNLSNEFIINAPIGLENKIKTIKVSGRSVELKKGLQADEINFTKPTLISALKLTSGIDIGATNIITTSTTRLHNIHVNGNQNITGNIGTLSNPLGTIKILNNNSIKINTLNFYTDVNTSSNNTGIVEFIKSGGFSYSLGDDEFVLGEIRFSESAEVKGSAYAKLIIVAPGKSASFRQRSKINNMGMVNPYIRITDSLKLEGLNSSIILGDNVGVRGLITTNIPGQGKVLFEGSAEIRAEIGSLINKVSNVTFAANSADKTIIFARNIHAETASFNKAHIIIDKGGTINASTTLNGTTITFSQHILIMSGGQSKFLGDPVFNIYFDNDSNSHLTVSGANSNVNLATAHSLTFNITDNSTLPSSKGRNFIFFREENGGTFTFIDGSKVIINQSNNPFTKWTYVNGTLVQMTNKEEGLRKVVTSAGGNLDLLNNALKLIDPKSYGSASRFVDDLVIMASTDINKAGDSLRRVIQATNPTVQTIITTNTTAQASTITARITNQTFQFRLAQTETEGIAAGTQFQTYGIWFSPFYSYNTQHLIEDQPGFNSKVYGGTIGGDTKINEELTIGIAASIINNKINYKNMKKGDTTNINSILLSFYGVQDFSNNWWLEGILTIGTNRVKNSKVRILSNIVEKAKGQYHAFSSGAEFLVGYNYQFTQYSNIIPMVGLRYNRFNASKYTEKGTTDQNLTTIKKALNKLEGVLGVKAGIIKEMKNFTLFPEIHGFVNYNFINKIPKIEIILDGLITPITPTNFKSTRTSYNLGLSLNTIKGRMEYELGYDAHIAEKYIGHQGTFKVRINL